MQEHNPNDPGRYVYQQTYYDAFGSPAVVNGEGPRFNTLEDFFPKVGGRDYVKFGGDPSGETLFLHADAEGTTGIITNEVNGESQDQTYYPYGGVWAPGTQAYDTRFGSLEERDAATGFDPTPARQYTSTLGRWLTPDPENAGAQASDPQSWNAYSYAGNNPTTNTDPSGLLYCSEPDKEGTSACVLDEEYFKNKDQYKDYTHFESNYPQEHPDEARVQEFANDINSLHPSDFIFATIGASVAVGTGVGLISGTTVTAVTAARVGTTLGLAAEAGANPEVQKVLDRLGPAVENPELQKAIDMLYQATDKLPGGTAGAVRHELAIGDLLSPAGHVEKAQNTIRFLERILREQPLSARDVEVARALIQDLKDALSGR